MGSSEVEFRVQIPIIDNNEWEPDLDFFVELYDDRTKQKLRLAGDDTECRVTILDEDFPGIIGFVETSIRVTKKHEKVDVVLQRTKGTDGTVSCMLKTDPVSQTADTKSGQGQNAIEYEDYLPKHDMITFENGEKEKIIPIMLMHDKVPQIDGKPMGDDEDENEEEGEGVDIVDVMFKVTLSKPTPEGVKLSSKNRCIVTI